MRLELQAICDALTAAKADDELSAAATRLERYATVFRAHAKAEDELLLPALALREAQLGRVAEEDDAGSHDGDAHDDETRKLENTLFDGRAGNRPLGRGVREGGGSRHRHGARSVRGGRIAAPPRGAERPRGADCSTAAGAGRGESEAARTPRRFGSRRSAVARAVVAPPGARRERTEAAAATLDDFREFMANHMLEEEESVLPRLRRVFSRDELLQLTGAVLGRRRADDTVSTLEIVVPNLEPAQARHVLAAARAATELSPRRGAAAAATWIVRSAAAVRPRPRRGYSASGTAARSTTRSTASRSAATRICGSRTTQCVWWTSCGSCPIYGAPRTAGPRRRCASGPRSSASPRSGRPRGRTAPSRRDRKRSRRTCPGSSRPRAASRPTSPTRAGDAERLFVRQPRDRRRRGRVAAPLRGATWISSEGASDGTRSRTSKVRPAQVADCDVYLEEHLGWRVLAVTPLHYLQFFVAARPLYVESDDAAAPKADYNALREAPVTPERYDRLFLYLQKWCIFNCSLCLATARRGTDRSARSGLGIMSSPRCSQEHARSARNAKRKCISTFAVPAQVCNIANSPTSRRRSWRPRSSSPRGGRSASRRRGGPSSRR